MCGLVFHGNGRGAGAVSDVCPITRGAKRGVAWLSAVDKRAELAARGVSYSLIDFFLNFFFLSFFLSFFPSKY